MTILCFTLTMPTRASWNGRWSGESKLYAKLVYLPNTQEAKARAKALVDSGPYHHHFGDGWSACVEVRVVTAGQAKSVTRKTAGFCGYDWMVDSIRQHGEIKIQRKA
ncbi:hypothetical protein R5W24_000538 [Gemmata sp. JC717]|uniref:hypothetical protein n=1 Tax=Gemmata algarum TaxID=2975278 RepID=UPI0021BA8288|nr:hypothetical protein [Gemmata algarum]MDY3551462.1 hypothetical protein [Gemmata algarum]